MEKYIERLYAKNMGKYKEAKIQLNRKFNFLVGANGCGKTTLIKYMAIILNPGRANVFRYGDNAAVWVDCKFQVFRISKKSWYDFYRFCGVMNNSG